MGTVFSGNGEGRKFMSLPWVKQQIQEKLGFTPYSGTLNIRLTRESARQKKLLKKAEKFEVSPEEGYCTGTLIEARMEGLKCGVLLPQVPNYPQDVLEVIAASNLREHFKLEDGSEVCVTVGL
jgi:riboflavin kinase